MSRRRDDHRVPPRPAPRAYGFTAVIRHEDGPARLEAAFARHLKAHLPDAPHGLGAWRLLPDDGGGRRVAIEVTAIDLAAAQRAMWVLGRSQGLQDHGLAIDQVRQARLAGGLPDAPGTDIAAAVGEALAGMRALVDGPLLDIAGSASPFRAHLPDETRAKLDALRLGLEEAASFVGLDTVAEPAEAPKPR